MDVKLLRAFIASPGGLDIEREAAFAAAAEVNRSVAQPLGARLELLGWEETLSGSGRPQAIINAEMETCDLFIGVMWTKWGSRPSLDGSYTSGFEEEFELSRERYGRTKSPLMAMFFKNIDDLQLGDPGDELKKVLSFQEKLRAEKAFLYDTFADAEGFAGKVRVFLSTHVIRLLNEDRKADNDRQSRVASGLPDLTDKGESESAEDQSEVAREESAFLQRVAKTLKSKDGPQPVEIARLRLVAASTKTDSNDPLLIGAHDANLIYENRANLGLSQWEKRGLLTAGLAGLEDQNVPLWTWLGELDRKQPAVLWILTIVGEDAEREGALKVLRLLRKSFVGKEKEIINSAMLMRSWFAEDRSNSVKLAALRYLRDLGTRDELSTVDTEVSRANKDTADAALAASLSILLRIDERAALERLLRSSFETLPNTIVANVLAHADELGSEELLVGLDHRSAEVRTRTIEVLGSRSALTIETLKRACEDEAPIVRLAAVEAFDRLGQPLSLDEALEVMGRSRKATGFFLSHSNRDGAGEALFEDYRERRLADMPVTPLRALLGSSEHKHATYRALAARDVDDFANKLRVDIRDRFESYFRRNWPEGIKPAPTSILGGFRVGNMDPNDLKRRELVRAALDTVVKRRDHGDLALVRNTLDINEMAPSDKVIGYLSSVGNEHDIPRLARASRFSLPRVLSGDLDGEFVMAAKTILKFAKGNLHGIVAMDIPNRMRAQLIDLAPWPEFSNLTDDQVLELLLADDEAVKRSAARRAAAALPRRRIAKILSNYRADPSGIYYIVPHWLDLGLGLPQRTARAVVVRSD